MNLKEKIFPLACVLCYLIFSPLVILLCILYIIRSILFKSNRAIQNPETVLITGASSGIGKHLALKYAEMGVKNLAITGRNKEKLIDVQKECEEKGAKINVQIIHCDVMERDKLGKAILSFDEEHPIDILIANAGISEGTSSKTDVFESSYEVFETNTLGVFNSIFPVIDRMKSRKRGQIAIVASLAAFYPLKSAIAYCASKSAVLALGRAYRALLEKYNVGVSIITPGFVKTPLTDKNKFSMPFMMTVDKAIDCIIRGLKRDQCIITFPFLFSVLAWFISSVPPEITSIVINL